MLWEMTDVSDHNLCPRMLWTPVFPRKILQDSPVQCRPDLLDPKGSPSLAILCVCVSHTLPLSLSLTHTHPDNPHPAGPQRERERNGSCHFSSFNWGSAAVSVTEPPRGGHQTKGKPFTLYCPLLQRAHISFLTLSVIFFILLPYSSHSPPPPPLLSLCSLHLCLYFNFKTLTFWHRPLNVPACQKYTEGKKGTKESASVE